MGSLCGSLRLSPLLRPSLAARSGSEWIEQKPSAVGLALQSSPDFVCALHLFALIGLPTRHGSRRASLDLTHLCFPTTCRSPAVRTALHVPTSPKAPSVAFYVVECTFLCGFDSFRAYHLFISQLFAEPVHCAEVELLPIGSNSLLTTPSA